MASSSASLPALEAVQVLVSSLADESPVVRESSLASLKEIAPLNPLLVIDCCAAISKGGRRRFGNMAGVFLVMSCAVRAMERKDVDSTYMVKLAKIATSEVITSKEFNADWQRAAAGLLVSIGSHVPDLDTLFAVIQGAGGMLMIDPLFQRILVRECRFRRIPVIFDEVFTGFWRLGRESAAELLGCQPDVSCFAKLMTGGVVPLAATVATESIFEAFKGDSKLMALLHGHSYSAHAVGCASAAKAIQWFKNPSTNPNIDAEEYTMKELWDMKLVHAISSLPAVRRVIVLGTLFAVELKADGSDAGYASLFASSLVQQLRADGLYIRPLGNVIYLMCGPCTSPHFCGQQLHKLHWNICEFSKHQKG